VTVRTRSQLLVWLRRLVQTACLLLFFGLFLATRDVGGGDTGKGPLQLFFDLDPLVQLATWLSTHSLTGLSLLAVLTLALTALLGRVFCGWICPLGTLHNLISSARGKIRRVRRAAEDYSVWQRCKYYLLAGLVVMAVLGANWIGVLDPLALLYRSSTTILYPIGQYVVEDGSTAVYQSDPHLGPAHLTSVTEPAYGYLADNVFGPQASVFVGSTVIFLIFAATLVLNLYKQRFWCRYLCPLGGLLGLVALRPALRLRNDAELCTDCGKCTKSCPGVAQPQLPGEWLPSECFGCWNCVESCASGGIDFHWTVPAVETPTGSVDLTKRATALAVIGGIGGVWTMRITPQARARTYHPLLIRPPGARAEREFLQRCIQCGMCMKVCPTNGLQPTWHEAGLEGVWTPMLVSRLGYCEYECNLCGRVCPTEAIEPLPLEVKKKVVIGLAAFDKNRCLPYAYDRNCMVCEEHCPIPTKAIYFVEKEVVTRAGEMIVLKEPRVDPELCIGCGICEGVCPFKDLPAIRVTSAGESRHLRNQPILPGGSGVGDDGFYGDTGSADDPYGSGDPDSPVAPSDPYTDGDSTSFDDPYGGK